jgi:transcriptional regulator with XRE-family HTH domain
MGFDGKVLGMPDVDYELLRDTRDERGLRTAQIVEQHAEELGIGRDSLDNIFCGNRRPSMRVVRALSRILDLPVERIIRGGGTEPAEPNKTSERQKDPSGPSRRQDREERRTGPKRPEHSEAIAS